LEGYSNALSPLQTRTPFCFHHVKGLPTPFIIRAGFVQLAERRYTVGLSQEPTNDPATPYAVRSDITVLNGCAHGALFSLASEVTEASCSRAKTGTCAPKFGKAGFPPSRS
jgi:hypothetical protein